MEIGAAIFFTDYSIAPTELAVALEERGFELVVGGGTFAYSRHPPLQPAGRHGIVEAIL